jgi:hypothetical protein
MQGTAAVCDGCGQPAAWRHDYRDHDGNPRGDGEDLCRDCAFTRGAECNGIVFAAVQSIGLAIHQLRYAELTDSQIRRAVQALIASDEPEHGDTACEVMAELLGDDCKGPTRWNRQWTRSFRPLANS